MKHIPLMNVGRYKGKPVDQLPNSYLRWIMTQDFPKEILDCAKKKVEKSPYNDLYLQISRHAIDMFSQRFLYKWIRSEKPDGAKGDGLATFVAKMAQEAWVNGIDISKHRHRDDGIIRLYRGIQWVFHINKNYPDYKDLITVMEGEER